MNYLAHLFLGRRSDQFMLGSFLGDFVRGPVDESAFPFLVAEGIRFHRAVDVATDAHPAFRSARTLLAPERRRFAGILVDIFFDHFLSVEWECWEPAEPLDRFIVRCHRVLETNAALLPDRLRQVVPRLRRENWLGSYGTIEGMRRTLRRVAARSPRIAGLAGGTADLELHHEAFRSHFHEILPDLIRMTDDWYRERIERPGPHSADRSA